MIRALRTGSLLCVGFALAVALSASTTLLEAAERPDQAEAGRLARQMLEATGVEGGLIVHLGCGDGRLTAALRAGDRYLVHGLDTDVDDVRRAREHVRSLGVYGPVSVQHFDGKRLPYVASLANLVVADDLGEVSTEEVMRVLAPLGVALVSGFRVQGSGFRQEAEGASEEIEIGGRSWRKTVKPWPAEIDEWRQYLHDADNNAVAHDTVAGPPRHLQWVGKPGWSRSHMTIPSVISMVSSKGRLFCIEDRATRENPFLPGEFALVARDAFNGVVLWTHDFPDWEPVTRYVKDIPVQLQRRLAAIGNVVYCTPGLNAPLAAFDAATGKVLKRYEGTDRTQEFAFHEGVLYLVVGDRMNAAAYDIVKTYAGKGISLGGSDPQAPFDGTGFRRAYAPESPDLADPICAIVAIEADSSKKLWRKSDVHGYTGCSLAIRGRFAVYQTTGGLTCLERTTGEKIWSVDKPIQGPDGTSANTLILSGDAVYAKEGDSLVAYSLQDGSQRWTAPAANNYEKSADVFVAAGAVWTGGSKQPTGYDPQTGDKISTIAQQMTGPMGHDRCYRNFITDRYYVNSKTGGADFVTLDGKKEFPNYWVRGTCGLGVLPANGLLYAPPYSCQCSIGAMIKDFNALYTEKDLDRSDQKIDVEREARLVKGPAYGQASAVEGQVGEDDWPTYRRDGTRGGATTSKVAPKLARLWEAKLDTIASAPVVAEGRVFVSDVDAHTVYALDASDGSVVWDYVAGGRVDSPPTYHRGLVLFGSRDGSVHCLRASDGALVWRFKDLPDKLIGAFGQLESAWPVCGTVLVEKGVAYFTAGRSSFLDGGIFVYALDPRTGEVLHDRQVYGPFQEDTGFPSTGAGPFKSDICVTDGNLVYVRHRAFNPDLTDAAAPGAHLIPSAGFLDGTPQHRTYWTIGSGYRPHGWSLGNDPSGDILVTDGKMFYEVRGFPVKRHSYFDPRISGYKLFAAAVGEREAPKRRRGRKKEQEEDGRVTSMPPGKWSSDIPMTGKAMVLADDVVFVAGTPAHFPPGHPVAKYQDGYEGELGGLLWAASATDGSKLAEYELDAPPAWDGMAAAKQRLFIALTNGHVQCWGSR